jgi:hypothetical protein
MTSLIAIALVLASCGDALGGVGDLSHRIVFGSGSTTTTTEVVSDSQLLRLRGSRTWSGPTTASMPTPPAWVDELVTTVWLRGQVDPSCRQSRREIAAALPASNSPNSRPIG